MTIYRKPLRYTRMGEQFKKFKAEVLPEALRAIVLTADLVVLWLLLILLA